MDIVPFFASSFWRAVPWGEPSLIKKHPVPTFEILPLYQIHFRELWHCNPEIRRSDGFRSFVLPAPYLCLASNAPNHSKKPRKMDALQAVVPQVWAVSSFGHRSVPFRFVTIAHPRDFTLSPKMDWLLPLWRQCF